MVQRRVAAHAGDRGHLRGRVSRDPGRWLKEKPTIGRLAPVKELRGRRTMLTKNRVLRVLRSPQIVGRVEPVTGWGRVRGHVYDAMAPQDRLQVELLLDGVPAGEAIADKLRSVKKSGLPPPSNYGFAILLPATVFDGSNHVLEVRIKGTTDMLPGGPIVIRAVPPPLEIAGSFTIDYVKGEILGWAAEVGSPQANLPLLLYIDGKLHAEINRNIGDQEAIDRFGDPTLRCGFAIRLPNKLLDGAAHSVSVLCPTRNCLLAGSPFQFEPRNKVASMLKDARKQVDMILARLGS